MSRPVTGSRHRAEPLPPNAVRDAAHISALTGVRAFASLWVFFYHAWLAADHPPLLLTFSRGALDLTPVVAFGWLGVDLFFVLSGFLLTRQAWGKVARASAAGERPSAWGETYWSFLRRRILRVYPAYYFTISILLVLAALHIYRGLPEKGDLFLHLLMFHNVVERYVDTLNGVFWSIPFEWQFYLVFPILFVALRRVHAIAFYAAFALIALAAKEWVALHNDGYMQLHLPIRLDAFVAGMCAATFAEYHRLRRGEALAAFAAGVAGLLSLPWVYAAYPTGTHYFDAMGLSRPLWIQASICLLLLGLSGDRHPGVRIFSNRVTVWLGLISYSIYLVHVPVLDLLKMSGADDDAAGRLSLARVLITGLPCVIGISAAFYYLVERPFQASGRRSRPPAAAMLSWRPRHPFAILGAWAMLQFAFLLAVS